MFRCSCCSREIVVDLVVPDDVWLKIHRGDYALCAVCMDERMVELGIVCEAKALFRGKALSTPFTQDISDAVLKWRPPQFFKLNPLPS